MSNNKPVEIYHDVILNKEPAIVTTANEPTDEIEKIYKENFNKIYKITTFINISSYIAIFSFMIFLITLSIRLSQNISFTWFIVLIPLILFNLSSVAYYNLHLKLKDIFDEAEQSKDEDNGAQIGSIISYISLNGICLSVVIYFILITLKLDKIVTYEWNSISTAIYIVYFIAGFYFVFILPAFIENKMYFDSLVIFLYFISSLVFLVLLNIKLDNHFDATYLQLFSPAFFCLGFHLLYSCYETFSNLKINFYQKLSVFIFLLFTTTSMVITSFIADKYLNISNGWIPCVLFLIGYVFFFSEKLINLVYTKTEEEIIN